MVTSPHKRIIIVGGPNGAGKTTFARQFLPREADCPTCVAERVRQGGHDVPEEVVRRRFAAGRENFETLYKPIVDKWHLYDNSGQEPVLLELGLKP